MEPRFADAAAMVASDLPDRPVFCVRPHAIETAARAFLTGFPGRTLYAVKCNDEPLFLDALYGAGIRDFDCASLAEIALVRGRYPDAHAAFMHPVKSRREIGEAFAAHGITTYVVDHDDELAKLREETGGDPSVTVVVRLATARNAAVYDLGGKFGMEPPDGARLLRIAAGHGHKVGLHVHVGSQCLDPRAYTAALELCRRTLALAGPSVVPSIIDVGGGFPIAYQEEPLPPPLDDFFAEIGRVYATLGLPPSCELWCEPGRALVGGGASVVVKVELRRDHALYLNDGVFGTLSDLTHPGFSPPMRVIRPQERTLGHASDATADFTLFGPTCDALDVIPGPFALPADIRAGDWIELGQMGAYSAALRTRFNGFYTDRFVTVADAPFLPNVPARMPERARA